MAEPLRCGGQTRQNFLAGGAVGEVEESGQGTLQVSGPSSWRVTLSPAEMGPCRGQAGVGWGPWHVLSLRRSLDVQAQL